METLVTLKSFAITVINKYKQAKTNKGIREFHNILLKIKFSLVDFQMHAEIDLKYSNYYNDNIISFIEIIYY